MSGDIREVANQGELTPPSRASIIYIYDPHSSIEATAFVVIL